MRSAVRILILCLLTTGGLTEPARSQSDRRDSYGDKIEQERKNLEKLRGSIEEKKKKSDEVGKKRESILQGLQSLDEQFVRLPAGTSGHP